MTKRIPYDRNKPYNNLPLLPPLDEKAVDMEVMNKLVKASTALGKLDGIVRTLPNPDMLVNTIALREAKDSSEIENIFTSNDELYQSLVIETTTMSANAKEVLNYREALDIGFNMMRENKEIDIETIIAIYQKIKDTNLGIRSPMEQTIIRKEGSSLTSGNVIYTPPRGKDIIEEKIKNWLEYCNDDKKHDYAPLLKMVVAHYQFEAIHPFGDGNGRTGRILNILYLNQKGLLEYPVLYLSAFIIKNKNDYYYNLGGVTERHSWKTWIMFILEGMEQTCYYTIQIIERINELHKNMKEYILSEIPNFNQEIIKLLFYQPYIRATNIVDAPQCGIKTWQTADFKLRDLNKLKVIDKKKIGRETVYINHQLINILSE
ncbi:MAG: Fic/DOC family protein [Flavobacteriales bacterium]|nr:Fic family protein [Bacteroidales bacterium AH-315-I05]PCJ79094.1 MAG: Fic/DOC family protein [Flavobacteriales bacterium]